MAGKKGRSGRKPTPAALKIARGTLAVAIDRIEPITCNFEQPKFFCHHAQKMWDENATATINAGYITAIDLPILKAACESWGLYVRAYELAVRFPARKDARMAVTAYWTQFTQAASLVGWSPASRARLKLEAPQKPTIASRKRG